MSQFINNLFSCLFDMVSRTPISTYYFYSMAFYLYFCPFCKVCYREMTNSTMLSLPRDSVPQQTSTIKTNKTLCLLNLDISEYFTRDIN